MDSTEPCGSHTVVELQNAGYESLPKLQCCRQRTDPSLRCLDYAGLDKYKGEPFCGKQGGQKGRSLINLN